MARLAELVQGERQARMALSMIAEPDDPITGRLLRRFGGAETLGLLDGDGKVPGLNRADTRAWRDRLTPGVDPAEVTDRLRQADASGVGVVIPGDREWPASLAVLGNRAPFVLWTRGAGSFLARPLTDLVAITGSRASTSYGDQVAGELATDFARDERVVVAGGSYGIEGAAHRAALAAGGDTIAVLAGGVDRPYPAGHRDLLDQIAGVGLLVSELPPGATPTRHRFLARIRLMAAMSKATIVVEAGARSSALHLANQARQLGRHVGAVPGPVTSAASTGPHLLLAEGRASIITHADQVTNMLHMTEALDEAPKRSSLSAAFPPASAPTQRRIDGPGL